jgi:hypothetical protein
MMPITLDSRIRTLRGTICEQRDPIIPKPSIFRRDELLDARFVRYVGGIKVVDGLDHPRLQLLISEGFLSRTTCATPNAPSAETIARFVERWNPAARAGGYARSHRTSDGAVVLDSISLSMPLVPSAARDRAWWEFFELSVGADGHDERDDVLRAWWES